MEYQLALAPSLEITPVDFVTAWNEQESTQEVAQSTGSLKQSQIV